MKNMRRTIALSLSIVMAVLVLNTAVTVQAGTTTEFSADNVMIKPDGKEETIGKIYVSPNMMRSEMNMQQQGTMISIVRQDQKKFFMIMPDKKKYYENPLTDQDLDDLQGMMMNANMKKKVEKLGTETVNGFVCEKQQVTTTMDMMGQTITTTSTHWKAKELDIPIRTKDDKGNITELRNIKQGPQPKDIFEIPQGYKKVANMMEMMMP